MNLQQELCNSILQHHDRVAFVINHVEHTYKDLAFSISSIRREIEDKIPSDEIQIGLVANNDLQTYAAIFAIWFEGKSFVPIDLESPEERNNNIISQTNLSFVIDSSDEPTFKKLNTVLSKSLSGDFDLSKVKTIPNESTAYILFTSGTTGIPKGVPITFNNLIAFREAFYDFGIELNKDDRCLQMFGLTFDVSVMSYMLPVLKGARIYTIPKDEIKFNYIFELIQDEKLTYALMVPSILHYLRPYFEEIDSPYLRYCLLCGEGLPQDVTEELAQRLPNTEIMNVYGPTECTMLCTGYKYKSVESKDKSHNGIVSIGKPWKSVDVIIIDEANNILETGEKGELCLAGSLLTPGYWNNQKKNEEAFFYIDYKGKRTRFYKTGDLCYMDKDDDIMFLGRIDFQAKVQGGYRVELSEIELYAKKGLDKTNVVAVAYTNKIGTTNIGLVIESENFDTTIFIKYLKEHLPSYMIPSQIKFAENFPLNVNGKIDRNELKKMFD
ncbi:AMP-binding protein [Gaetbulibacter aquiaggeris]|uniref:AMP-binding protein n=1 Tax=Gaetbulibacter aquiaggeris TaxID=1735373 RepID=A0ABW7MR35_9FLAO